MSGTGEIPGPDDKRATSSGQPVFNEEMARRLDALVLLLTWWDREEDKPRRVAEILNDPGMRLAVQHGLQLWRLSTEAAPSSGAVFTKDRATVSTGTGSSNTVPAGTSVSSADQATVNEGPH